jgi:hypothetical protein
LEGYAASGNSGNGTGAPPNDLEAAILATVTAGRYTAILSGNGGGTGIGLVVYKLRSRHDCHAARERSCRPGPGVRLREAKRFLAWNKIKMKWPFDDGHFIVHEMSSSHLAHLPRIAGAFSAQATRRQSAVAADKKTP